eukprot:6976379-Pyramimonas_sp.AAC.1
MTPTPKTNRRGKTRTGGARSYEIKEARTSTQFRLRRHSSHMHPLRRCRAMQWAVALWLEAAPWTVRRY